MVGLKIFNFQIVRSVIIARLKKVAKIDTCEYTVDTGSDCKLKPIKMFKTLFPHTKINEL